MVRTCPHIQASLPLLSLPLLVTATALQRMGMCPSPLGSSLGRRPGDGPSYCRSTPAVLAARPVILRMAYPAGPSAVATWLALEAPSHRGRRMTRQACSSAACPGGSTTPTGLSIALWRLPQWNDIGGRLGESLPRDFDPMLDTGEH